jgi:hypothetical protein
MLGPILVVVIFLQFMSALTAWQHNKKRVTCRVETLD